MHAATPRYVGFTLLYMQYRTNCFEILILLYNENYSILKIYSFVIAHVRSNLSVNFANIYAQATSWSRVCCIGFAPCLYHFK